MKSGLRIKGLRESMISFLGFVCVILFYLPYFILGEDSRIMIHDNLDSNIVWMKIMIDQDILFSSPVTKTTAVMNGVARYNLGATYDIPGLIFQLAGMFWGLIINKLLIGIGAYWGMFLLLKGRIIPEASAFLVVGLSVLFAILPFWSFTFSVMGVPLALYALMNIRSGNTRGYNWLILIVYAFHSSLILVGVFLLFILGILWLRDLWKTKNINPPFLVAILLLGLLYLLSHFPVISSILDPDAPVSHRMEFVVPVISFKKALSETVSMLLFGQYHAQSLHTLLLLPILVAVFFWKNQSRTFRLILWFLLLTSLFYGFKDSAILQSPISAFTKILPLRLERFHFLHPALWFILAAYSLYFIAEKWKHGALIVGLLLFSQLLVSIGNHELVTNSRKPSYAQFFDERTFGKVAELIDRPQEDFRVICVGMHPAVAQYNGFYTLDAYLPNYPLPYKNTFREVIAGEVEKDEVLRRYFDEWGSRCYAFSSELGTSYIDPEPMMIQDLNYDFEALKSMGGEYILSSASINLDSESALSLQGIVNEGYWNVHVYKVLD